MNMCVAKCHKLWVSTRRMGVHCTRVLPVFRHLNTFNMDSVCLCVLVGTLVYAGRGFSVVPQELSTLFFF